MGEIERATKTVVAADRDVTLKAAEQRDRPAVKAVGFLAEIGDQPQLVATSIGTAVIGMIARRPDMIRGGLRMLAAHGAATFVKSAIKRSVDRTRPEKAIEDGEAKFEPGDSHDHAQTSFPSGHTAGAVAVARAVSRDIGGAGAPAAVITGMVAAAQPINGKHYLSDLVVGAAVGWIAEALVSAVFDRVAPVVEHQVGSVLKTG
ncbi:MULTISPECIES: phosphatase PAP2 family protein [unclassified Sphingomonas]|jgi:membrane-associated phospholipid phosphatase|uniref:phosphatase PAP2 family protein n=1 Tax=unclassified Sphingomonas TaxID=196159 RepID=UPI0006FD6B70|nr:MULTISPECIES: phosphatase PAP2 family protein [unclassified Sphingomonas]KQN29188.1 PA-phosphatase [Sphingomonas sp. Leaf38]KQN31619.1 PA-phosphatase [Sphingomonas sp. Leaf34]